MILAYVSNQVLKAYENLQIKISCQSLVRAYLNMYVFCVLDITITTILDG